VTGRLGQPPITGSRTAQALDVSCTSVQLEDLMFIRKLAGLATITALGLLALGATSASASTQLRLDPGNTSLMGSTTITNTSSGVATFATHAGMINCSNTSFTATALSHTGPTTIGGNLSSLTFTTCTDTLPLVNISSCHRHGATLPSMSISGSLGTVTLTDVIVRCNVVSSTQGCYYTAATAVGSVNNALSTLAYTGTGLTAISSPTTDAVAPGACGTTGTVSVNLRHIVQFGTNKTVTIQP
jgi:hypothetical protein